METWLGTPQNIEKFLNTWCFNLGCDPLPNNSCLPAYARVHAYTHTRHLFFFQLCGWLFKFKIDIYKVWYWEDYYISFVSKHLMTLNFFFDICTVYFVCVFYRSIIKMTVFYKACFLRSRIYFMKEWLWEKYIFFIARLIRLGMGNA